MTGLPVLVEAYGPSYGEYARVAMNTGLPIVLGWDYHVFQRGHGWAEINRRKADLETIFTSKDEPRVAALLRHYHAALVYVGPLERRTYAGGNLADFTKWTDLLTPVYRNPAVTIFAVNGSSFGAPPPLTVETAEEPQAAAPPAAAQDPLGVLRQPRGIACDRAGNVYVADFGNCRIQKFDRDLKPVAAWGRRGTAAGEFQDPCDVAVGPDGNVYVADTWNGRVQVFDPAGHYLREFGTNLYGPRGIAVDSSGRVWVADTGNNRLVRFSADGNSRASLSATSPSAPQKARRHRTGIALDAHGRALRLRQRPWPSRRCSRRRRSCCARLPCPAGAARSSPSRTGPWTVKERSGSRFRSPARCAPIRPRARSSARFPAAAHRGSTSPPESRSGLPMTGSSSPTSPPSSWRLRYARRRPRAAQETRGRRHPSPLPT